jgi:hypothetical protein
MAKKRKNTKKHRFSPDHVQTGAPVTQTATSSAPAAVTAASTVGYATALVVRRDVVRVLLLAGGFIALMIVLWALFTHTGLGSAAYNAVKL